MLTNRINLRIFHNFCLNFVGIVFVLWLFCKILWNKLISRLTDISSDVGGGKALLPMIRATTLCGRPANECCSYPKQHSGQQKWYDRNFNSSLMALIVSYYYRFVLNLAFCLNCCCLVITAGNWHLIMRLSFSVSNGLINSENNGLSAGRIIRLMVSFLLELQPKDFWPEVGLWNRVR